MRRDVYDAALEAAQKSNRTFSLTAPTGSGKTLAMLGFALRHAIKHGKRKIIFVFPYLTLIEQAAKEINLALKPLSDEDGYIFQDHSHSRDSESGFSIPNWNEPIIITTTIKFFESLFANKPTRLRHLHNIANSVVLFDEAQSMPFGYASQTLKALDELCKKYGTTVVLSTATQPAFDALLPNWSPEEIAPPELNLFQRARRVEIKWTKNRDDTTTWEELAECIAEHEQSLTMVNTRAQAQRLARELLRNSPEKSIFHLSTNMCIAHRNDVLNTVRSLLADKLPCTLVSTQCIEAGVDISFPVVFRAMGPLDSVIQAFGRCNRNGERPLGDARVFLPPTEDQKYPDGTYEFATLELMRIIKSKGGVDICDPAQIRAAFETLMRAMQNEGVKGKYKEFADALSERNYERIDEYYKWIDERGINVIVPYKPKLVLFDELVAASHGKRIGRDWLIKAQSVGVNTIVRRDSPLSEYLQPIVCHYNGETLQTGWFYPISDRLYDDVSGLRTDFQDAEEDFILQLCNQYHF